MVRKLKPRSATKKPERKSKTKTTPPPLAVEREIILVEEIAELRADFWPEQESIDEFIATVRQWRKEGR